jgi:hypothetical protein
MVMLWYMILIYHFVVLLMSPDYQGHWKLLEFHWTVFESVSKGKQ